MKTLNLAVLSLVSTLSLSSFASINNLDCAVKINDDVSNLTLDLDGGPQSPYLKIRNGTVALSYKGKFLLCVTKLNFNYSEG